MPVKLNSTGGGSVTLTTPSTASDFTLTVPAQTATLITNSSGVLDIGSGQIYKDASGNVGIGTSSPDTTRALTLNRTANYGGINFQVNGSTQARIQQESTGSLYIDSGITTTTGSTIFRTANGSERMRIDSSGNVGIGTSSPGSKLEINQGILTINTSDQSLTRLELKTTGTGGRTWDIVGGLPGVNNSQFSIYDVTAAATRMTINSSGDFQFNSGYGSVATAYGCRAWVNFNGTGTVAIRASGNVTSITDNGTGDYTVNFTTAMPDANYGFAISGIQGTSSFLADVVTGGIAAGTLRINTRRADTRASDDISVVAVSIFR